MIVRVWEVKRVACYARAETFTGAVASVASMVARPLQKEFSLTVHKLINYVSRL